VAPTSAGFNDAVSERRITWLTGVGPSGSPSTIQRQGESGRQFTGPRRNAGAQMPERNGPFPPGDELHRSASSSQVDDEPAAGRCWEWPGRATLPGMLGMGVSAPARAARPAPGLGRSRPPRPAERWYAAKMPVLRVKAGLDDVPSWRGDDKRCARSAASISER